VRLDLEHEVIERYMQAIATCHGLHVPGAVSRPEPELCVGLSPPVLDQRA
jgi:hypothetical protein